MAKIKNELSQAQKTVFTLEDSEKMLRERLADEKHRSLTLEKVASIQKQKSLPKVLFIYYVSTFIAQKLGFFVQSKEFLFNITF